MIEGPRRPASYAAAVFASSCRPAVGCSVAGASAVTHAAISAAAAPGVSDTAVSAISPARVAQHNYKSQGLTSHSASSYMRES